MPTFNYTTMNFWNMHCRYVILHFVSFSLKGNGNIFFILSLERTFKTIYNTLLPLFHILLTSTNSYFNICRYSCHVTSQQGSCQPRSRPSIFIYIFLIFSAFSHEKSGTRWFGGGAEEGQIEGLVDFPTTRPKLPWNCPGCEMPNYCVLKHNYLQLNSEFKPIQVQ
jgi:hypothetical protein